MSTTADDLPDSSHCDLALIEVLRHQIEVGGVLSFREFMELALYHPNLGYYCKKQASGWDLWLLNGNPELSKYLGMKASKRFQVNNGSIDCRWLNYKIK